jgi:hypothetical protein
VSSNTIINTFGDPGAARTGWGHAGLETSVVRPITPGNTVPGSYSLSAIDRNLHPHPEFPGAARRENRARCVLVITRIG